MSNVVSSLEAVDGARWSTPTRVPDPWLRASPLRCRSRGGVVSPADIVDAGITVGVRVEHVVELPGGDGVRLAIIAAGGQREGNTEVYAGLDSDGVEWRIAVMPGGGVGVYAPSRTGAQPTEQARFSRMDDARFFAAHYGASRRWLTWQDIRIGDPFLEYAGPNR